MGRKRKRYPLLENVKIEKVAAEGKSLAHVDDKVVFVTEAVPGDVADIQVTRKKKSFMEGRPVKYHVYSDIRTEPFCEHFDLCGGCKWQHLPYDYQLQFKQQQVEDHLSRIGKLDLPKINPILGSEKQQFYRNKLEFTFSAKRWMTKEEIDSGEEIENPEALGFHIPKYWDKVIDIKKCWLQPDPSNEIRLAVRDFALKNNLSFFNLREKKGFLRNLIIRTSPTTGQNMVIVVFFYEDEEGIEALMEHLKATFPDLTSLMYIVNEKANDSITDQEVILYAGKDYIKESMENITFRIGPKSFYQTNSQQAYQLYNKAREYAQLSGNEVVYDLYTGTGTIANFVAKEAGKVVGVEYVEDAIVDAKKNAEINAIDNTEFYAGDMKDVLTDEFIEREGKPDVIITDPPRAGMHPDVVKTILRASPERIVYVSCNPATQARDLQLLDEAYKVTRVQPVDMFPHTHHVENIVQLQKR